LERSLARHGLHPARPGGDAPLLGQLEEADPFYNADKDPKFDMPGKKEIYLLKIKS